MFPTECSAGFLTLYIFVITIIKVQYEWDEQKRRENLKRHGLDFRDAAKVYEHPVKMTIDSRKRGEDRKIDIAPIEETLIVMTLVYIERGPVVRIISLRRASRKERSYYYEYIENS